LNKLINSSGKLLIFPEDRKRIKNKKRKYDDKRIIVNVSYDFVKYYQWFLYKQYGIQLQSPEFMPHITITNGNEDFELNSKTLEYLESINNTYINFKYSNAIYTHWEFFSVLVYSKELDQIRSNLGLKNNIPFHITLGRKLKIDPVKNKTELLTYFPY